MHRQPGEETVSGGAAGISTRVTGGQVELRDEARAPLVIGQRLQVRQGSGDAMFS